MLIRTSKEGCNYVLEIGSYTLLLGCGIDLSKGEYTDFSHKIDCVLLVDSSLTTCAGLPLFLKQQNYKGPIVSSHYSKYMAPRLINEYIENRMGCCKGDAFYTPSTDAQVHESISHTHSTFEYVTAIGLGRAIQVINGLYITALPSGHMKGGVMFHIQTRSMNILYSDAFDLQNQTTVLPAVELLLITTPITLEISDTKTNFQHSLLKEILQTIQNGGKVLIPIYTSPFYFKIRELIQNYATRTGYRLPMYGNRPDLPKYQVQSMEGCIVFESPGIITGSSVFKSIVTNPKNLLILTEYCLQEDTVNYDLVYDLSSKSISRILDKDMAIECNVHYHPCHDQVDVRSVLELSRQFQPKHMVITQPYDQRDVLRDTLEPTLHIGPNTLVEIQQTLPLNVSFDVLDQIHQTNGIVDGILVVGTSNDILLVTADQCCQLIQMPRHDLVFLLKKQQDSRKKRRKSGALSFVLSSSAQEDEEEEEEEAVEYEATVVRETFQSIVTQLQQVIVPETFHVSSDDVLRVRSIEVSVGTDLNVCAKWGFPDEELAIRVLGICNRAIKTKKESLAPVSSTPPKSARRAIW